jgi:hypothetical protein
LLGLIPADIAQAQMNMGRDPQGGERTVGMNLAQVAAMLPSNEAPQNGPSVFDDPMLNHFLVRQQWMTPLGLRVR